MADPAKAQIIPPKERRRAHQAACRAEPCFPVERGDYPPCVLCVHESRLFKNHEREEK